MIVRQLQVTGNGGLESLRLVDASAPEPAAGQVVVQVKAASLSRRDLTMVKLKAPGSPPTPIDPMSDRAGVVHSVGPDVSGLAPGDRVTSLFFQKRADVPITPEVRWITVPGLACQGVGSELALLEAQGVYPSPPYLTDLEASTLPRAARQGGRHLGKIVIEFEEGKAE